MAAMMHLPFAVFTFCFLLGWDSRAVGYDSAVARPFYEGAFCLLNGEDRYAFVLGGDE
jgi:hypothetical protein